MKIKISMDSTCDLSQELIAKYEINVLPLFIQLGDELLKDGSFETNEIYKFVEKNNILPKTSAVNTYDFEQAFKELTADGSAVIHFSISSELSACCQNAKNAAKNVKNVFVVDSRQLSTGSSLLALFAVDQITQNPDISAEKLADSLNAMADKVQSSFCVDTINYLYKGGRCSALSLLGANILKIHPSLHLKGGLITVGKKYRGKMNIVVSTYIADLKEEYPNYDNTRCFVTYTPGTSQDVVDAVITQTKNLFDFKEILETQAGSTVTSHCGQGTIGLLFINK